MVSVTTLGLAIPVALLVLSAADWLPFLRDNPWLAIVAVFVITSLIVVGRDIVPSADRFVHIVRFVVALVFFNVFLAFAHIECRRRLSLRLGLIWLVSGVLMVLASGAVPIASTLAAMNVASAEIAESVNSIPIRYSARFEARRLVQLARSLPGLERSEPAIGHIVAAFDRLFNETDGEMDPRRFAQRVVETLQWLGEANAQLSSTQDDLTLLLHARLALYASRHLLDENGGFVQVGDSGETLRDLKRRELALVCHAWQSLKGVDRPEFVRSIRGSTLSSRAREQNARAASWANSMAAVYLACARSYEFLEDDHFLSVAEQDPGFDEMLRRASELLGEVAESDQPPMVEIRTLCNQLDVLLFELVAEATERRTPGAPEHHVVPPARTKDERDFQNGEARIAELAKKLEACISAVPQPELMMTLAQAEALLAHACAQRTRFDRPSLPDRPGEPVRALDTHLAKVVDYSRWAVSLGMPAAYVRRDVAAADELGLAWILGPQQEGYWPVRTGASIRRARERLWKMLRNEHLEEQR